MEKKLKNCIKKATQNSVLINIILKLVINVNKKFSEMSIIKTLKTRTLCSKCNKAEIEENEREIEKIREELNQYSNISENYQEEPREEERKVCCRFCSDECPSIFSVCEKTECLLKHDNSISNISFDNRERERERE